MPFYEFSQNNSGGTFTVDDDLCGRLIIEADSPEDAISKAEDLGCYWDGVAKGIDCPCCGDRWYRNPDEVNIEKYATEGYDVYIHDGIYSDTVAEWNRRYGKYAVVSKPKFKTLYRSRVYSGKIRFRSIKEYAQFMADEYDAWTSPDTRIFYLFGDKDEVFSARKSSTT